MKSTIRILILCLSTAFSIQVQASSSQMIDHFTAAHEFELSQYLSRDAKNTGLNGVFRVEYQIHMVKAELNPSDYIFTTATRCLQWDGTGASQENPGDCAQEIQIGWYVRTKPVSIAKIKRVVHFGSQVWADQLKDYQVSFYADEPQKDKAFPSSMKAYLNDSLDQPMTHNLTIGNLESHPMVMNVNAYFPSKPNISRSYELKLDHAGNVVSVEYDKDFSHLTVAWSLQTTVHIPVLNKTEKVTLAQCNPFFERKCELKVLR